MLILLMVLHFIADFLLQSRQMGQKKSEQFKWLVAHLSIQFAVFFVGILSYLCIYAKVYLMNFLNNPPGPGTPYEYILSFAIFSFQFSILNTLIHGIIDWNIWKLYKVSVAFRNKDKSVEELKKTFQYWNDHLFYTTIGFDQLLHTATIVALYSWLVLI